MITLGRILSFLVELFLIYKITYSTSSSIYLWVSSILFLSFWLRSTLLISWPISSVDISRVFLRACCLAILEVAKLPSDRLISSVVYYRYDVAHPTARKMIWWSNPLLNGNFRGVQQVRLCITWWSTLCGWRLTFRVRANPFGVRPTLSVVIYLIECIA